MDEEIKKLWEAINGLQEEIGSTNKLLGSGLADVRMLKDYLELKENDKRNDNDILSVKLKREVMTRPHGMLTRDVTNYLGLKHTTQAVRVMERAAKEFSEDIMLHIERGKHKTKRRIVRRKAY